MVEHRTENPGVGGSIPPLPNPAIASETKSAKDPWKLKGFHGFLALMGLPFSAILVGGIESVHGPGPFVCVGMKRLSQFWGDADTQLFISCQCDGRARQGTAGLGEAGHDKDRQGRHGLARQGLASFGAAGTERHGSAWSGKAKHRRQGLAW